jgi:tRNA A-37 threonylcarbamoyl transferase component Bud32
MSIFQRKIRYNMLMTVREKITIKNVLAHDRREEVCCSALLREVPNRRRVFEGTWQGRSVIVKLYIDSSQARRHFKKEWKKLSQLHTRKLNAPEPLFYGRTDSGWWALVMEKITNAQSAYEVWSACKNEGEQKKFMERFIEALAEEHAKGVIQDDLQLDNFLIKDSIFYPLDAYQMRFFHNKVDKNHCIEQLALLGSQFKFLGNDFLWHLCVHYEKYSQWSFTSHDRDKFFTVLERYHQIRVRKRIKKFFRSNKRHKVLKDPNTMAVIDRRLVKESSDLKDLINHLDTLMDQGEVIKQGNTCSLSRFIFNSTDIVVKRYNYQGIAHSLKITSTQSRARLNWINAIRLGILNIPTPDPLAFIEKRKGPFIYCSYYITKYVPSVVCGDFLIDDKVSQQEKSAVVREIVHIFEQLQNYRISHGDMKNRNILLTDSGPFLIDLDSMKFHHSTRTFMRYWRKDINRFIRNWRRSPLLLNLFLSFPIFNENIDRRSSERTPIS